ncbi:MAG: DUF3465 domain-containing protein [Motiliproteus sp.]
MIKKLLLILILAFSTYGIYQYSAPISTAFNQPDSDTDRLLQLAFETRQQDLQVNGSGEVIKLLNDDLKGSRHQRFLLRLASGQTLLVAHNIDLAPKISLLRAGDNVEFFGEYEWTAKGGVIHWTHHDPKRQHQGGWLKHQGKSYQ